MDPEVNSGLCMEITITSHQQEFPGILGAAAVTVCSGLQILCLAPLDPVLSLPFSCSPVEMLLAQPSLSSRRDRGNKPFLCPLKCQLLPRAGWSLYSSGNLCPRRGDEGGCCGIGKLKEMNMEEISVLWESVCFAASTVGDLVLKERSWCFWVQVTALELHWPEI